MPHSFAVVYLHVVFATKHRYAFLEDKVLRTEMHRYLAACSAELRCPVVEVGGVEDHVHLLVQLPRTLTIADWVREIKRASSRWAKTRTLDWAGFGWQNGYGAFSVSQRNLAAARAYLQTQEAHHQQETFPDEYRALLRAHGLTWDETDLWE